LSADYEVQIFALTITDKASIQAVAASKKNIVLWGLKVSAQNFESAKNISAFLKQLDTTIPVIWGGELPTLLPEECLKYADTIVQSLWEPVADEFIADLKAHRLKKIYSGNNNTELHQLRPPRFDLIQHPQRCTSFRGFPPQTSTVMPT